jgi:hypothetical protein
LIPLAGDLDGDGYADPTFRSPVTGNWYILLSCTGYEYYYTLWFGDTGATAALGDFDGDFLADPILRSPAGSWNVLMSSMNYQNYFNFSW